MKPLFQYLEALRNVNLEGISYAKAVVTLVSVSRAMDISIISLTAIK
jgi:hypothetical protein